MSRIGRAPIKIPQGVTVTVSGNTVTVKGKNGELSQDYADGISVQLDGDTLTVSRADDSKRNRSNHGLYRTLIANMVTGVSEGFSKTLEIQGVGYRAELKGNTLILNLGYSSPVWYDLPAGIKAAVENQTRVTVSGAGKEQVGQVAAEIRSIRAPEPYKGKGIRYADEVVRRKVGKSGGKGKK